jgi:hypothetical protein
MGGHDFGSSVAAVYDRRLEIGRFPHAGGDFRGVRQSSGTREKTHVYHWLISIHASGVANGQTQTWYNSRPHYV